MRIAAANGHGRPNKQMVFASASTVLRAALV
jgi:hypothetical protein